MKNREFNWINIFFFSLTPTAAIISLVWYTWVAGIAIVDIVLFISFMITSLLAISAGYHRYFSHRTYQCNRILQFFYLIFGAATMEMSALDWSSDHRIHHREVDKEEDPYDISKGFFWAHMGWLLYKGDKNRAQDHVQDLKKNSLVMWQHRWFLPLGLSMCFGLPTLVGWAFGHPLGGFIWGGLVRMVVFHHVTFFINSAAHYFGTQPYSNKNSSRDHWILAFLTFGEGYHNSHHTFQGDYRNGYRWYHFDPAKWWTKAFSYLGWSWSLNAMPEWAIIKAKMEMKLLMCKPLLEHQPDEWRVRMAERLEASQVRIEGILTHFREVWRGYQAYAYTARVNACVDQALHADWVRKIREARKASVKAFREYRKSLRQLCHDSAQVVNSIAKPTYELDR